MARENAAVLVASQLRSEILEGDIAAGSKLSQQSIAERFGVAAFPCATHYKSLAVEGLVDPRRTRPPC